MVERGTYPKSLVGRTNGCRELGCCSAMCSRFDASGFDLMRCDPLNGTPCFPFYRLRESMGYNGRKEENERERKFFKVAGPFFSFVRAPLTWQVVTGTAPRRVPAR